ncbi:MAG TPA: hypothetical protein VF028_05975 [Actinomycetota bacterium]|jgi:hypothetical protein|nr:hypothetical protein [Actinomycetota bacterium]
MITHAVPGFLPSASGIAFPNRFPRVPVRRIGIPGIVSVPIGDASNGLCGGMAFAVRDYFEAGKPPPGLGDAPGEGTLFDYLVDRLFDSFDLPLGPARYLKLMSPHLPDGETFLSRFGIGPHGRAWLMVREEWPKVRADIDAGHPSPLGLVRVKSNDPFDLKENNQVLAYGYDQEDGALTLRLYDPNLPKRDDVTMSFSLADPNAPTPVRSFPGGPRIFAFFRVPYARSSPPAEPPM